MLCDDKRGVGACLALGKKTVQVETADNKLLTITIPDLNDGVGYNLEDEEDRWEFEDQVQTLEDNHYLEMIAVMAVALCGIKLSFINWYPLDRKFKSMPNIYGKEVTLVKSLDGVYDCTPDEF